MLPSISLSWVFLAMLHPSNGLNETDGESRASTDLEDDLLSRILPACPAHHCANLTHTCLKGVFKNMSCGTSESQCCAPCDAQCEAVDEWFVEHRDNFCTSIGGRCKHNSNFCNGTYESGMCGGPSARQCCAPPGTFAISTVSFVWQSLLFSLVMMVNILVVSLTIADKKLHTIPNTGICSLAIADFILAVLWFAIQALAFQHQRIITSINKNFRHLNDIVFVCEMSIVFHILLITLDRFLAIVFPLRHMSWCRGGKITARRMLVVCLLIWGLAAFAAYTRRFNGEWLSCPKAVAFNLCRTLVPLTITAALNIKIFHTIETKTQERAALCPDTRKGSPAGCAPMTFIQQTKAARTVALILVSVFLAYAPLSILTMVSVCGSNPGIYVTLSDYVVFAKLANSLVNPTIYAITTNQFMQSLRALTGKICGTGKQRRPASNRESGNTCSSKA